MCVCASVCVCVRVSVCVHMCGFLYISPRTRCKCPSLHPVITPLFYQSVPVSRVGRVPKGPITLKPSNTKLPPRVTSTSPLHQLNWPPPPCIASSSSRSPASTARLSSPPSPPAVAVTAWLAWGGGGGGVSVRAPLLCAVSNDFYSITNI